MSLLLSYPCLLVALFLVATVRSTRTYSPTLDAYSYSLGSESLRVQVSEFGAYIMRVEAPDREGVFGDVGVSYQYEATYLADQAYLGCVVGRVANRIEGARFSIDGTEYHLAKNNGRNAHHGGIKSFCHQKWSTLDFSPTHVTLSYTSPDGEEGYPGTVTALVTYTVVGDQLSIEFEASTDKATVINLTSHAYFNLARDWAVKAGDHVIQINSDRVVSINSEGIPLAGPPLPVNETTAFDLRKPVRLAEGLEAAEEDPQVQAGNGYDHTFVLASNPPSQSALPPLAAQVFEPVSGRVLQVYTDQPGIHLYTGNFFDGSTIARNGKPLDHRRAFALETQHFPNSPNRPDFPSTLLLPGDTFTSRTVYRFTCSSDPDQPVLL